ncbi:MAG: hypothetical protein IPO92_19985 [Saprospiraceae bacterium]|nr:hypothetical protein [Saprospiraceae bacterium]
MMYGQFNIRINEINNYATVIATSLFIRPCAGCTSNVTIGGQNARYGQNSIVALTGATNNISGIIWYEVYLTTDCSSPTGWLSSGMNSSFLFINSNTNNYYNVAGTVKNDNDVHTWGANINIGSWTTNSTEGFYQYKVPQNWTGLISCSHQSYNTSSPPNYSHIASSHNYSRNFVLSNGCSYSISPSSVSPASSAGSGSVSVTPTPGCSWTAISNNTSWLTVTSGSSGTGNGTVGYSYTLNPNSSSRTGTITIADKTLTVIQAGNNPQPTCTICDTKPWNTPFGACASGHTNSDLIEWPSDITVVNAGYLPSDLQNNSNLNNNDVRPRFTVSGDCDVQLSSSYLDQILTVPTGLTITRTWSVLIINNLTGSFQTSTYIQTINVTSQNTCSSPTTQANNILFTSVTAKQMTVNWNNGNGSRRVVKINTINSFTPPSHGSSPSANSLYTGNGEQIVYNGSSNNVTITGLSQNTIYWVRVYEAKCDGTNSFYNTTVLESNPRSQTTPKSTISGTLNVSGNLDFGSVPQGSFYDKGLVLFNNTSTVLKINNLIFEPSGVFSLGIMQNGNTILPGKSLPISIFFTPPGVGLYTSTVTINTDIPNLETTFNVRGEITNNQPSWIGIYNELENNPESKLNQRYKLDEYFINQSRVNPINICADGSSATIIKFVDNKSPNIRNLDFRIKNDPNKNNPDYYGSFINIKYNSNILEINYLHPKYLNTGSLFRQEIIEIWDKSTESLIHEFSINIYRTPVVLIHGLWGNKTSLKVIYDSLIISERYNSDLLYLVNFENSNSFHFSKNANVVKGAINDVFFNLRRLKFSCGKVDIVAHSMGESYPEYILQNDDCNGQNKYNCYRSDINKLITINTPHSGTQAANYLLSNILLSPCLILPLDILFVVKKSIQNGAVSNLRCDSPEIMSLNSAPRLNKHIVPSHTIQTTALYDKKYTINDANESFLINSISNCRQFESRDKFLKKLFANVSSDYIVLAILNEAV